MQPLSVEAFFDLKEFSHPRLFAEAEYVWEALGRLKGYLEGLTLGNIAIPIPKGVFLVHPEKISIGEGTKIEPGAYIEGPCVIGKKCVIRHGAYLRGNVVTGDECIIGHDTEIKHSILFQRACAPHFNYLGDSILGNRVNLGAGVKCANLRLDGEQISVLFKGQRISTHLKKLGAILGDEVHLGCNSVTNPGTLMGKKSSCHPCLAVSGYIPPYSLVKPSHKSIIDVNAHSH